MKKSEVQALYTEVKRQKLASKRKQGLMEPRTAKSCGCGGSKRKS